MCLGSVPYVYYIRHYRVCTYPWEVLKIILAEVRYIIQIHVFEQNVTLVLMRFVLS